MDSKYLHEIRAIIQKDIIQSTYKLALLRAIIEIAQESNGDKITLNGTCAYPFSLLQRKLLIYYYPLFAHSSFIPQMHRESPFPRTGKQLIIRTRMDPIVQYYRSHGDFEGFLSDLENDKIPNEIAFEFSKLLETIRKTFIAQPMKYLGNSLRPEGYTVVQYLAQIPHNDNTSVISPAATGGYHTIPSEYARVFEDRSCAQELLDLVIRRWIEYTLTLSDNLNPDELRELLAPGFETEVSIVEPQPARKLATTIPLPAPIFSAYAKVVASQGGLESPVSTIPALEEAIQAEYTQFSTLQQDIQDSTSAMLQAELRVQKIAETIQRIGALYDISPQDNASRSVSEALSQYYAEQLAAHDTYSATLDRVAGSRQQILELKQKQDLLWQKIQKATRDIATRERQKALIDQLRHNIALLDDGSGVQPRSFGYVDKPIARFLMYCSDVAENILSQCILLIPDSSEKAMVKPALPAWFIEEFDSWWRTKQDAQRRSRESGSGRPSSREPFLVFDERRSEVLLTIPSQSFEYRDGLDHISLIVHDGSQILHEKELPLYYQDDRLGTEEITVRVERPSRSYHVDLSAPGVPPPWVIDGFRHEDPSRFFDADTGRCIDHSRLPSKRFILLTPNRPTITPETAVLFTGRLFDDWYDFQYYIIDPIDGLSISDRKALSGEEGRGFAKLDLYIDPEYFDKKLRIDGRNVVTGPPPPLQVSFENEEILSRTVLSIHPLDRDSTVKPTFHPLTDLCEGAEIDPDRRICTVDLSHPNLLGKERVGAFTIRIRNENCRTDIRVECVFLPHLSYRFSQPLFLPAADASPVQLEITCPQPVHFEPEGPVEMEVTMTGFLVTSNLVPEIQGTLRYPAGDGSTFEGMLLISIPHVAWRFEDGATGITHPLNRSVLTIPDTEYLSLGTEPGLRIFLPASFNGVGTISMLSQDQAVTGRINNGQGYFPLARFNDTLRTIDAKTICFEFVMEGQRGGNVTFPLFTLQRWRIQLSHTPRVSFDQSGNRVVEIAWEEYGFARKRFVLLWRKKESGGASCVYTGEIPASVQTFTITGDREQLLLGPGTYYIQFHRAHDDWSYPLVVFPGEKAPNVFRLLIEWKRDHLSEGSEGAGAPNPTPDREGDNSSNPDRSRVDSQISQLIRMIESNDAEGRIRAIKDFKKDYSVYRLEYRLLDSYPILYERLQVALLAVITDTGMSPEIRATAVEILGKNFSQEKEYALIRVLRDPDSAERLRIAILKALSHGNTEECLGALLDSLNDSAPEVRGEAATSLGNIDNKHAVNPLIELLNDESVAVQRKAVAALGYTRSLATLEPLISIAFDESRDVDLRITAIAALARFKLRMDVIQNLFVLSENEREDEEVRKIATSALSIQGALEVAVKKKLIAELIQEMKSLSQGRRISAIKQLSTFSDEEVVLALMEATQDESTDIRRASADSLRRINSLKAIPALVRLRDDSDDDVRESSEFACKQLLQVLLSNLKLDIDKRNTAARHLAELGSFAVNPLFAMLCDAETIQSERATSTEIRKAIVRALSRMNDPSAIELMIQALQTRNDWVVWGAARALGIIGNRNAIEPLEETLMRYNHVEKHHSRLTFVRVAIKWALDQLKG